MCMYMVVLKDTLVLFYYTKLYINFSTTNPSILFIELIKGFYEFILDVTRHDKSKL